METRPWTPRKVVVVGAGAVGSTFAYGLLSDGAANEVALIDTNRDLAEGQVLDLAHGLPFCPSSSLHVGSKEDYRDAHVIVVTAGAGQRPGETRLSLLQRNAAILQGVVDDVVEQDASGVMLIVTNPVDPLTYLAAQRIGWPRGRVIGSGTVLDSARLRYLLSQRFTIDIKNVHAYVLGEHGDSEFVAWSMTHLAGISTDAYCPSGKGCGDWQREREQIEQSVRDSAYHIIDYKGATSFAVGLALVRIVEAILRNQQSVLTVSTVLDGEYGQREVSLGVPCVLGQEGVERVIHHPLPTEEQRALSRSADCIRAALGELAQRA